jgi:hypothetical protein
MIRLTRISLVLLLATTIWPAQADNPIVQTNYTADPAPMVHDGTVYLYTSHDEDKTVRNFFTMNDWRCYSSTDMVNWTDRGVICSYQAFNWSRGDAWAGQCVFRNGKYFYYLPVNQKNGGNAIGVAVSDSPTGPFKDALGAPLLTGYGFIDPTVFIDDDGQAYLYWGNPNLWYVKLNPDMLSYDLKVGVVKVPLTKESFQLRTQQADMTFAWASSLDGTSSYSLRGPGNKFYWFVGATEQASNRKVIGVGVGDRAIGPFKDALGKPLVTEHVSMTNLDLTVVTDNDKQVFLVWGDTTLWSVKLNSDLISYEPTVGVQPVPSDKQGWFRNKVAGSSNSTEKRRTTYEEGPWLFKSNSRYYLLYPAGGVPEHFAYSTSSSPTGPWLYGDTIMEVIKQGGAFTNHPGCIEFKGKSYLFYHNGALPGGGGFKRSVCIEQFTFNPDGSIPLIQPTKAGVLESAAPLNPFVRTEAETIAWEEGIETAQDSVTGVYVTDIGEGDCIKVRSVDFGKGAKKWLASIASGSAGNSIELRLDTKEGMLLGTLNVPSTGSEQKWKTLKTKLKPVTGVHDVFFRFKGSTAYRFDWWKFE